MSDFKSRDDVEHLRWEMFRVARDQRPEPVFDPSSALKQALRREYSGALREYLILMVRSGSTSPDDVEAMMEQVIEVAAQPLMKQAPSTLPTDVVLSSIAERMAAIFSQHGMASPAVNSMRSLMKEKWDTLQISYEVTDPRFTKLLYQKDDRAEASRIEPAEITYASSHPSVAPFPAERQEADRLYFEELVRRFGEQQAQRIFERYTRWADDDSDSPRFPAGRGRVTLT